MVPAKLSLGDGSTGGALRDMLANSLASRVSFSVDARRHQQEWSNQSSMKFSLPGAALDSACCARLCLGRFASWFGSSPVCKQRRRLTMSVSKKIHWCGRGDQLLFCAFEVLGWIGSLELSSWFTIRVSLGDSKRADTLADLLVEFSDPGAHPEVVSLPSVAVF